MVNTAQQLNHRLLSQGDEDIKHGWAGELPRQHSAHAVYQCSRFYTQLFCHGSAGMFSCFNIKYSKLTETLSQLWQPFRQFRVFGDIFGQRFWVNGILI